MLYELDSHRKSTKTKIIEILSTEWPLTTKKIYNRLKKHYQLQVTYQAVHLSMKEFLDQGIVVRIDRAYMLSPQWIDTMATRFNNLIESYTKEHKTPHAKDFQELNFSTVDDAWNFLLTKSQTSFFGSGDICYLQFARLFAAPPSVHTTRLIKEFTIITPTILLCRRKGVVEKIVKNYLERLGLKVHLGLPVASPTNTIIIGECVIQIYVLYSQKERRSLDRFYYSIKNILKQDIFTTFSDLLTKDIKVKVTINRDPEVYQDVREQTEKLL